MKPIQTIKGPAAALPSANVDTDQIIPSRFMSRSRDDGYGDQCFHDMRFAQDGTPRADWPLNAQSEGPTVLVADENFGCGSSREAAVYALMDFGVKTVIAPSFGDIFRSNAGKNGLLTIALTRDCVHGIMDLLRAAPDMEISIDLSGQRVRAGDMETGFEIDARLKYRLERGLDELSATLELENCIAAFETDHLRSGNWRIPTGTKP
jgi:3-isopropylmalate/(R)-2-methylmalate dehydratase small subunit